MGVAGWAVTDALRGEIYPVKKGLGYSNVLRQSTLHERTVIIPSIAVFNDENHRRIVTSPPFGNKLRENFEVYYYRLSCEPSPKPLPGRFMSLTQ